MSYLALYLLGPPQIEQDGKPVDLNRRKGMALMAYLAINRESHRREALATLLWPDYDQSQARAALGTTLWALRKSLGKDWLDADRRSIKLNGGAGLWIDVNHFYGLLAECQTHGHPADDVCPACRTPLTEAAELYRDDFLAGFTLRDSANFDDWQSLQTEYHHQEIARILSRLVTLHSNQGEFDLAITYARRWLALDPLHEPAHQQMMLLYAWSDQRAAALQQYQECARLLEVELGISPHQATVQLYTDIKENRPLRPATRLRPRTVTRQPHGLPAIPMPFVGREEELNEIGQLLRDSYCRLVTLTGPGGIGKTRLALQAAIDNASLFSHGACFVPLAALNSPHLLAATIADALRIPLQATGDTKTQLFNYLQDREILLLLDNLEHLVGGTGLLTEILGRALKVKMLATSREQLNLQWEWRLEITGLAVPEDERSPLTETYSAVQLFLQSARKVHPGFTPMEEDWQAMVRICRHLEGMPLGIELAASWVPSLSCDEIAGEIERDLDFLTSPLRDIPDRHRSLRAVFDSSWELLSAVEQRAFRQLSVFRGGFRRPDAESLIGASLPLLSTLVSKSFLQRDPEGRYQILEILRQYAEEKLSQDQAELEETRRLHSQHYTNWLNGQGKQLKEKGQKNALGRIAEEIENVRAAWAWAVAHADVEGINTSLEGLYLFYTMRSWLQEGRETLAKGIEVLENLASSDGGKERQTRIALGKALAGQAWIYCNSHWYPDARRLLERSCSILQEVDAREEMAMPLNILGVLSTRDGEYQQAEWFHRQSLEICQASDNRWELAHCYTNLGNMASRREQLQEAEAMYRRSITICQDIGDRRGEASNATNLGLVAETLGNYAEARQLHQTSFVVFDEIGEERAAANCLNNLGFALYALGEHSQAGRTFHQALRRAVKVQATEVALEALVGTATLLALEEEESKTLAAEIITRVLAHPMVCDEIGNRAESLQAELDSTLTESALTLAQERARREPFESFLETRLSASEVSP